ncbi:hypothetical protein MN116_005147 [Schistosoma mekongi]|uniref:Calcineurin-like phosphoesterase domain-containing protein n=1 Tax=Schistosoma mekongi TaxID=38744 RepID=A0AAE1ZDJ5_SCHME|nr:hypothetical protein MN116_005147 [Schistosoma mekongi]
MNNEKLVQQSETVVGNLIIKAEHKRIQILSKIKLSYCANSLQTSSLLNFRNLNVYVVGEVGHPKAKVVRIVHISDTRGAHDAFIENIPKGHILIHSGDFTSHPPSVSVRLSTWYQSITSKLPLFKKRHSSPTKNWLQQIKEIDKFFSQQPHDVKIFVPGCWETWYSDLSSDYPTPEKIQSHLTSAIYLEDSWCQVFGLTIYGIPWTAADDLRPEDGTFIQRHFSHFRKFNLKPSTRSLRLSAKKDVQTSSKPTNTISTPHHSKGFVLPNIEDVSKQWQHIPDNTDVVVTHMPAWRPELYSHIADRVKPVLHLCGHDFAGYGVMWKKGTLFCNAALQLTSTFPATGLSRHHSKKFANHKPHDSNVFDGCSYSIGDFKEPPLYTAKPNGRPRPPRWQRELPRQLLRLFSSNQSSSGCSFFRRTRTVSSVIVTPTQSSKAAVAHTSSDIGFIYDPDMRAGIGAMAVNEPVYSGSTNIKYSGGGIGLSGSNVCSSICRRSPIVVDVYVVNDDQSIILPPYASSLVTNLNTQECIIHD